MASGKIIIRPRKIHDNSNAATPSRLEIRNPSTPAEDRDTPTNDNDNDNDGHDDGDDDAQTTNAATPASTHTLPDMSASFRELLAG